MQTPNVCKLAECSLCGPIELRVKDIVKLVQGANGKSDTYSFLCPRCLPQIKQKREISRQEFEKLKNAGVRVSFIQKKIVKDEVRYRNESGQKEMYIPTSCYRCNEIEVELKNIESIYAIEDGQTDMVIHTYRYLCPNCKISQQGIVTKEGFEALQHAGAYENLGEGADIENQVKDFLQQINQEL
ncbi:MAG: hypothetical protein R3251_03060 [Candidatus Spechtbacterales bacterium]|nr:hypothetical protein [Candidatus Spechtbacterales bacterium]